MAFWTPRIVHWPITTSLIYLVAGMVLGPLVFGVIRLDPLEHTAVLERLAEVAVIVSLFATGLKLRSPIMRRRWWLPVRLAFVSMTLTVGFITLAGVYGLGLPLPAAILLGAVLAPTDPVLASEVEVRHGEDRDRFRFSLTGEAGLNDGTAFPFLMLGLGLFTVEPDLGTWGWRWWTIDVVWAIVGGLGIGAGIGWAVAKILVALRRRHTEDAAMDDFLALGVLAITYGLALWVHTYGFLAAFALGLALRRGEQDEAGAADRVAPADVQGQARVGQKEEIPAGAPRSGSEMSQAVLGVNQQLVRFGELVIVVLIGAMLGELTLTWHVAWFVPLVLLVIRPAAVLLGLLGARMTQVQWPLVCWFGIRGIGSLYYLMYALERGVPEEYGELLTAVTLATVAISVTVHGISVTPLMKRYEEEVEHEPAATAE